MPEEANIMRDAPAIEVADLLGVYSKRNHHPVVFSLLLFRLAIRTLEGTS